MAGKNSNLVKLAVVKLLIDTVQYIYIIKSDNGKEFAMHQEISKELYIDFYFANPYSSWEWGTNENLNRLLMQYITKPSSFEELSEQKLHDLEEKINNRPGKKINFKSPNFMFNQKVEFVTWIHLILKN